MSLISLYIQSLMLDKLSLETSFITIIFYLELASIHFSQSPYFILFFIYLPSSPIQITICTIYFPSFFMSITQQPFYPLIIFAISILLVCFLTHTEHFAGYTATEIGLPLKFHPLL